MTVWLKLSEKDLQLSAVFVVTVFFQGKRSRRDLKFSTEASDPDSLNFFMFVFKSRMRVMAAFFELPPGHGPGIRASHTEQVLKSSNSMTHGPDMSSSVWRAQRLEWQI